ncbi:MAG TPA: HlyD family efflux transporter periplasmic adaptor subunit [Cellvibrionaceae bacterium]
MQNLHPLRSELQLHPAGTDASGAPLYRLYDPAVHRFYQITWPAYEILTRWQDQDAEQIVAAVNSQTTLEITEADIQGILSFLIQHHLVRINGPQHTEFFSQVKQRQHKKGIAWLIKNYLFFRIPLIKPEPILQFLLPLFNRLLTPTAGRILIALTLLALYLISRQWDQFTHTFNHYTNWQGVLALGGALFFAKIIHEFGHALTAYKYGCRVPTMGVAVMVLVPVFFTDTNDAWRLSNNKQRFHIAAAGIAAELTLAVLASLAWCFLPEGPIKACAFLLATSTWLITIAINASPFMRFDGYFLLADYLNMPNLHERSFAMALWWLREKLFALNEPISEQLNPGRKTFLILFALATLLYRAVLFLGIAFLVYGVFFKLLGIILMLVELGWFIAYPVKKEVMQWWQRRHTIKLNRTTARTAVLASVILGIFLIPWQGRISAPAVIMAEHAQGVYNHFAAQVVKADVREGDWVNAGDTIAVLANPQLNYNLKKSQIEEQNLRWQLNQQSFASELFDAGPALQQHWQAAKTRVQALQEQINQLNITAPISGRLVAKNPSLINGAWLAQGEQLFYIANNQGLKGEAYLSESDARRVHRYQQTINNKNPGIRFIANQPAVSALKCAWQELETQNTHKLQQPLLASNFGGPIAVQETSSQNNQSSNAEEPALIPNTSQFRLRFKSCAADNNTDLGQELAGVIWFNAEPQNLIQKALRRVVAVWVRESGF